MPSTAEQLAGVQSFFGLSKTQLAQVCKVQRQTVYDWYAGNFEAEGRNARRLAELYGIIEQLRRDGRKPLPSRVVARALLSGSSLLDLLSSSEVDSAAVGAIVAQLDETAASLRSRGAAAMRERLGWPASSSEVTDANLETNLNDFVDG
jgi:DNA-binding XRE family transcriptional regulator